jgi:hypothetical protein
MAIVPGLGSGYQSDAMAARMLRAPDGAASA